MLFYIVVIVSAMAATVVGNYFLFMRALDFNLLFNIWGVVSSTVAVIALDGLIALLIHKLQRFLSPYSLYFRVGKTERKILEKLGVKRFKSFLPDLGTLAKFPKGKIADPKSKEYIYRYIMESCSGELNHVASMFLGILIIFLFPLKFMLCFAIPVASVNLILNLLPVLSLRYNRSKLVFIYERLVQRETKHDPEAA